MKFEWSPEKNSQLKKERGISFEVIILSIEREDIWMIADHPNQERFPDQKIFYVVVDGYIYLVPFVEDGETIFLKTIFPSRKATKKFHEENE